MRSIHIHLGQIVSIHDLEYTERPTQVVEVNYPKGKVLVNVYPNIDYNSLLMHGLNNQYHLNSMMDKLMRNSKEIYLTSITKFKSNDIPIEFTSQYFGKFQIFSCTKMRFLIFYWRISICMG